METHKTQRTLEDVVREYATPLSVLGAGVLISMSLINGGSPNSALGGSTRADILSALQEEVLPQSGVALPVALGDLGAKLVEVGAIDLNKFEALYKDRGGFPDEYRNFLEKNMSKKIVITNWNAGYLLNLFWALGLANENPILKDESEMMNPKYGGAGNFASTGGWTLARGDAMDHYGMHKLINLNAEQQALVDRVSRNIYRPCCGNSTHFPDCNHGMAMLGLLELMASQGVGEQEMYRVALAVNSYWFPDTYLTIAAYMQQSGISWKDVSPKEMLGRDYSSAGGFANISSKVIMPRGEGSGGGCSA